MTNKVIEIKVNGLTTNSIIQGEMIVKRDENLEPEWTDKANGIAKHKGKSRKISFYVQVGETGTFVPVIITAHSIKVLHEVICELESNEQDKLLED